MNILTFDIEDWFHTHQNRQQYSGHIWKDFPSKVAENTNRILNLLDKYGLKATFFVLGWIARYHPEVVRTIQQKGHEIASHSFCHHNPHLLTPDDFARDLKLSLDILQDITGKKITAYRAPGFNLNNNDPIYFQILAEQGIRVDSSVQLRKMPEDIPYVVYQDAEMENKIWEFPLITTLTGIPYSGGGYFRAFPERVLKWLFRQQQYHLFYFHPRDFDPRIPAVNLFSVWRNTMNRLHTDSCQNKLETFLSRYKTLTLSEAVEKTLEKNRL